MAMGRGMRIWGRWVVLVALVLAPRVACAESPWGLVLGMNRSWLTGSVHGAYPDPINEPMAGVSCRIALASGWHLRTGVEVTRRGGSREGPLVMLTIVWDSTYATTDSIGRVAHRWRASWVDIPLVLERRFGVKDVRPYVFGGPALAFRVEGDDPGDGLLPAPNMSAGVQWRGLAGGGLAITQGRSLVTVELLVSVGLSDVFAPGDGPRGRSNSVAVRLGITP
jgi:hypothetical protein